MVRNGAYAFAVAAESEDLLHDFRFDGVDFQLLLYGVGARLDDERLVAVRRGRAVPESEPRIFLHRAQDVLGRLAALVFIEHRAELAEHLPRRVRRNGLRDRD
ncbi:MAG: hypothetical protein WB760_14845 [Xanthobacteraceae bacterium]